MICFKPILVVVMFALLLLSAECQDGEENKGFIRASPCHESTSCHCWLHSRSTERILEEPTWCIIKWGEVKIIQRIIDTIVPDFVQNLFGSGKDETSGEKESGSLDSFGRDIVRNIAIDIKKLVPSEILGGLDTNQSIAGDLLDNFNDRLKLIFPGTEWCGSGDKADSVNDLGTYSKTDSCCREHDMCPDSIKFGGTKYGLKNTGLFKRSACECDMKFHKCLKEADNSIATEIGISYFTILGPQCFQKDYPIAGCKEEKLGKCVEYEYDSSGEKRYQWFDNPRF